MLTNNSIHRYSCVVMQSRKLKSLNPISPKRVDFPGAASRFLQYALVFVALLGSRAGLGQVTIASDGLNNSTSLFTLSGGAYYTGTTSSSADAPASAPYASEGTHSRGIANGTATLTTSNINTSAYAAIQMEFKLASYSIASTNNGADGGDIVTVAISPDGGTTYYNTVRVLGNNNARWSWSSGTGNASTLYDGNATSVDFTPAGGGARTADGYSTVTIANLPATSNLRVRITLLNDNANERWLVDDFKITASQLPLCGYTENFDGISATGTAPPVGWSFRGALGGDNNTWGASIPASGAQSAASAGTLNNTLIVSTGTGVSSNTQGYNFGASANSNRALGTSPTSDAGNILELLVTNTTGSSLSTFSLSYDVRRFTSATTANELPGYWVFVSSNNGTSWTEVTALRPTIITVPNTVGVSNFGPTQITLPSAVANNSPIRIRWVDDNATETSPDQIIGLDNVVLSVAPVVTFNANGGTGSMSAQTSCSAANLTSNAFTRAGYTFSGWNTAADGSGTAYANGASYPFTASATLYAQWTANSLTITYDSQGGSAIAAGSTTTGGSIAASPGTPTRAGYTFNGWFAASSGGSAITFPYSHGQTASFTLYAQWTLTLSLCGYSENFNGMGASGTNPPTGWSFRGVLGGSNNTWGASIPASGAQSAATAGTLNNTLIVSTGTGYRAIHKAIILGPQETATALWVLHRQPMRAIFLNW